MFCNNRLKQSVKSVLITLLLWASSCKESQPREITLGLGLRTHYQLIQEGETGSARVRLRQFMSKHGEGSQPLFLMGLSYHSEKKYSKAVEWFEKSINPELEIYPPSLHYLGWSQFYLGNAKKAGDAFKQFLLIHPEEADSIFALGLLAMEQGELQEAEALFLSVIKLAPKNKKIRAKATARLADVMVERDEWQRAIRGYEDALQRNPDLYEAWYRYATVLKRIGRNKESEQAFSSFEQARRRIRPDLYQRTGFPE